MMYVCMYVRMYVCMFVCMYVCMYVCMHLHLRLCIHLFLHNTMHDYHTMHTFGGGGTALLLVTSCMLCDPIGWGLGAVLLPAVLLAVEEAATGACADRGTGGGGVRAWGCGDTPALGVVCPPLLEAAKGAAVTAD